MNKIKIIKISMILCIIVIFILLICIFSQWQNTKIFNKKVELSESEDLEEHNEEDECFKKVKYRYQYYTVKNLAERYIEYTNDSLYSSNSTIKELSLDALYSIMDKEYLKEYNISNKTELLKKYNGLKEEEEILIQKMYVYELETNIQLFLVQAKLSLADETTQLIVKMDTTNSTFSIFPYEYILKNGYSEKTTNINISNNSISKNEYNTYMFSYIGDEEVADTYFNNLKKEISINPANIYDKLDEEYRKAKFSSKNEFVKYINDNMNDFSRVQLQSYKLQKYSDYNEYICIDQFENEYVFKEYAVNDYTIQLDRYTIKNKEYINTYEEYNEQEKIIANIEQWIKMLNRRDYKTAYSMLDDTFKNNNFGSEAKFEQYMREAYPLHYKPSYTSVSIEGKTYVVNVKLNSIVTSSIAKEIMIIMRLEEGTDYVMSFEIK